MEDTTLKKAIVVLTLGILVGIWLHQRPHTLASDGTDITYTYATRKINARGRGDLPLVIALHGNGDTIGNFQKTLFHDATVAARLVFIQGPYKYQLGHAWPISGDELQNHGEALAGIVEKLREKYPSSRKPVLVGFSGGGCLAYYHAALHPDMYSAIIPISARLDPSVIDDALIDTDSSDIVAIHGRADKVIPFNAGKNAVSELEKLGRPVDMIELPGGHLAVFTSGHEQFKQVLQETVEHET